MTKVFLDTNIWLRPLVETVSVAKPFQQIFQAIDKGMVTPYTSTIVFLEVYYVLVSFYGHSKTNAAADIKNLLKTKNLTLIEKTDLLKALDFQQQTNIKLTDCLIATQSPPKTIFITNDKDFKKFPNLIVKTPAQLLLTLGIESNRYN